MASTENGGEYGKVDEKTEENVNKNPRWPGQGTSGLNANLETKGEPTGVASRGQSTLENPIDLEFDELAAARQAVDARQGLPLGMTTPTTGRSENNSPRTIDLNDTDIPDKDDPAMQNEKALQ